MNDNHFQREIQWLLKEKYAGKATEEFNRDVDRLKRGEPLDFVIGFVDFLGCRIDLSRHTLIPRVETEYWLAQVLAGIDFDAPLDALDIFCGSGCIGIAVLAKAANARVVFADKEANAIEQTKINLALNRIDDSRWKTVASDMFEDISGSFDIIFANPPYIPFSKKKDIQPSVLKYEPQEALFGGSDGMQYIEQFLSQAAIFLKSGGSAYMEFDPPQTVAIEKILKKCGWGHYRFIKDQYNKPRCLAVDILPR